MLKRIAANNNEQFFVSVTTEDVLTLENNPFILLNTEDARQGLSSLLVPLAKKNDDVYLSTIDAFGFIAAEQINSEIAVCLISTAIEAQIRTSTDKSDLDINKFISALVSNTVIEDEDICFHTISPFFKITCALSDEKLKAIVQWVDSYATKLSAHFCVHIDNMRGNLSDKIMSHCVSLLGNKIRNTHAVFSGNGYTKTPKNNDIHIINLGRLSQEASLSSLESFCEKNNVKCNRKFLKQIIELTQCHPYYLQKLSDNCLHQNVTNNSIKNGWGRITEEIGAKNISLLHSLSNNAFNLLLGVAQNKNSKPTSKAFCEKYKIPIGSVQRTMEQLLKVNLASMHGKQLTVDDPALTCYLASIGSLSII